jgi:hypothetical protein
MSEKQENDFWIEEHNCWWATPWKMPWPSSRSATIHYHPVAGAIRVRPVPETSCGSTASGEQKK